ncbi:transglycosylase SLT domain-containing protein [Erwinia aphidicola]|uniref:transglycosylase SLT domain-containing protein n=1 Tax=Erwinia aphidicola TaxID=68334 RepID=UPI00300C8047
MTTKYDQLIEASATANGLDPKKLRAQIQAESNFDPTAVSPVGARGIAQIMPKFWQGKYGLNTIEDFDNPDKAIPAMAQIMAQHVKSYGDWNAALVAYNAGPGKKNKNINAFKAGQYDLLPAETRGYLAKQSPELGIQAGKAPGVVGLSDTRVDLNTPVQQTGAAVGQFRDTTAAGAVDSFIPGVVHSAIGTAFRRADGPMASLLGGSNPLSPEALAKIEGAKIGPSGATFVMRNAMNEQQVDELITLAQENQAAAKTKRTFMGDLSYGVGEMLGDPITYGTAVFPGGAAIKAGRLFSSGIARVASAGAVAAGEGALGNLLSESIREGTTGVEADYAGAIAAGAAFGLGLHGVAQAGKWAIGKAGDRMTAAVSRAEAGETTRLLQKNGFSDAADPTVFTPMDIDNETGIKWKQAIDRGDFGIEQAEARRGPNFQPGQVPAILGMPNGGVLHTATGIQFGRGNPLNPTYQHAQAEMTAQGVTGVEIGDVLGRTTETALKDLFWNLGRATRGYSDGSSGKFGVTGQDVSQNMTGRFHDYQYQLNEARVAAEGDPLWANYKGNVRAAINERVQRAIHKKDPKGLSKGERQMYDLRDQFYKDLGEQQVAPGARWGVDVEGFLDEASFKENYGTPIIYDDLKVRQLADQIGEDTLQDLIARSFVGNYLSKAEVRKAVNEAVAQQVQATGRPLDVQTYARNIAYGIVKSGDPLDGVGISHLGRIMDSGVGHLDSTPGFRKPRNPFGHDFEVEVPGTGDKFSVADLFSYDTDLIDQAYFNRVRGDVSLAVGMGSNLQDVSDIIRNTRAEVEALRPENKAAVDAAEMLINQLYGVGSNSDWHRLRSAESILKNIAFMKSSAFMGLSNFTEIASGIRELGAGFMVRAVPGIGKIATALQKGKVTEANMRIAQNLVWGRELDKAIIPTFSESIERSIDRLTEEAGNSIVNRALGATQGAVQGVADRWWAAKFLRATTQRIVEQSRGEFFADLAQAAHGQKSTFANAAKAKKASVTPEQLEGALQLLRESTTVIDGELRVTNPQALVNDPRASALRRYGQHWSEQVIQQNTASSTFRWANVPLVGMLSQFQSFVMRSVNAKLIRGTAQTLRGDHGAMIDTFILGPTLAGLGYAGMTYLRAQKFSDENDRKKFLSESLGEPGEWDVIAAGALKRSAAFGAIGNLHDSIVSQPMVAQWIPEWSAKYGGLGRTSQEAKLRQEKMTPNEGVVTGSLTGVIENAPSLKVADSILGLGKDVVSRVATPDEIFNEERWTKNVKGHLKGLVPNDPISQRAFQEWIADPF